MWNYTTSHEIFKRLSWNADQGQFNVSQPHTHTHTHTRSLSSSRYGSSSIGACAFEWRVLCALDSSERAVKAFSKVYRVSLPSDEFLSLVNRSRVQYVHSPRHTELRPQTGASHRRSEECELRPARASVLSTPLRCHGQVKHIKHTDWWRCVHANLNMYLFKNHILPQKGISFIIVWHNTMLDYHVNTVTVST